MVQGSNSGKEKSFSLLPKRLSWGLKLITNVHLELSLEWSYNSTPPIHLHDEV